ncbi:unnamed protein product [Bursaphelenchus okinawaensis]|uniref:BTB domain-containing protein n=1 Tax=Bursaphelenchus okinawaensis TaxID=465554 RepID=A0A811LDR8_9BILA|nr:unnamed protein product [Bursaphelenchus okinawaensis]CAG9121172.1 unnamed protein product [Bursaphelenchus okinawaensis]
MEKPRRSRTTRRPEHAERVCQCLVLEKVHQRFVQNFETVKIPEAKGRKPCKSVGLLFQKLQRLEALAHAFHSALFCGDINLVANDGVVKAHSFVLKYRTNLKPVDNEVRIKAKLVDVEVWLRYVYTGTVNWSKSQMDVLSNIANEFGPPDLACFFNNGQFDARKEMMADKEIQCNRLSVQSGLRKSCEKGEVVPSRVISDSLEDYSDERLCSVEEPGKIDADNVEDGVGENILFYDEIPMEDFNYEEYYNQLDEPADFELNEPSIICGEMNSLDDTLEFDENFRIETTTPKSRRRTKDLETRSDDVLTNIIVNKILTPYTQRQEILEQHQKGKPGQNLSTKENQKTGKKQKKSYDCTTPSRPKRTSESTTVLSRPASYSDATASKISSDTDIIVLDTASDFNAYLPSTSASERYTASEAYSTLSRDSEGRTVSSSRSEANFASSVYSEVNLRSSGDSDSNLISITDSEAALAPSTYSEVKLARPTYSEVSTASSAYSKANKVSKSCESYSVPSTSTETSFKTPETKRTTAMDINLMLSMKVVKTTNITPMPNYKLMSESELNACLDSFGIRPMGRKRAIEVLTRAFQTTHLISDDGTPTKADVYSVMRRFEKENEEKLAKKKPPKMKIPTKRPAASVETSEPSTKVMATINNGLIEPIRRCSTEEMGAGGVAGIKNPFDQDRKGRSIEDLCKIFIKWVREPENSELYGDVLKMNTILLDDLLYKFGPVMQEQRISKVGFLKVLDRLHITYSDRTTNGSHY